MRLQDQQPPEHSPADATITPGLAEIITDSEPPKAPAEPAGVGHSQHPRGCHEERANPVTSDQGRCVVVEWTANL